MSSNSPTPIQSRIESYVTSGMGYYQKLPESAHPKIELWLKLAAMDYNHYNISLNEYNDFILMAAATKIAFDELGISLDTITDAGKLRKAMEDTDDLLSGGIRQSQLSKFLNNPRPPALSDLFKKSALNN
jgi:hypothetical protein